MSGPGSVRPTGWRSLSVCVAIGAGVGWFSMEGLSILGFSPPQIPLAVSVITLVVAVVVGFQAVRMRRHNRLGHPILAPEAALALLALGKAALLAGVGMASGFVAVALHSLGRIEAAGPRERLAASVVAALASAGLAACGAFLEWSCRVPRPPEDEDRHVGDPEN